MSLATFHPAVQRWFQRRFQGPTKPQELGWPVLARGEHTLIAAPTGSGKTLAAFLAAIDQLFKLQAAGELNNETRVLYVSPLKALSNDIHRNLAEPLAGISNTMAEMGYEGIGLTRAVRTGDTSQKERQAIAKNPPHILVTTPESFYLLLTSESGRRALSTVDTLIIDEIHALVGNRRGAHLALSMERLQALTGKPLQRIGLSATQKPMELVARFLVGAGDRTCHIVDEGHLRQLDLQIVVPDSPLEAVMANESWEEIYHQLADLIEEHHTTLIFANTRRLAERVTFHLSERLGNAVTSHHGSLSLRTRHLTEQRLKDGSLKAVVATASLELGIDIGHVDLVCQLGSPRAVSTFLQRIGRSGHYYGGVPKGRLFPLTRDELVECTALLHCVERGILDRISFQPHPIDVLCQQIVAAVACEDWTTDQLYQLVTDSWLYKDLPRTRFDELIHCLADGYDTRRGRRGAYLYYDGVNGLVKARKGARLAAITNGGAIPDNADYSVFQQPQGTFIGTVNEDFAVESMPGDVFQLGNHSWRILKLETGKVLVEDAAGLPPSIPFWFGEAPARSAELSRALAELRDVCAEAMERGEEPHSLLAEVYHLDTAAARQVGDYLQATHLALGTLPSQTQLVIERFFDEAGGMQLVIHSPFGARLNRAWGLSLRKRFCRSFNFELQAAASDDAIVLSLGPKHSFPLEEVYQFLSPVSVRDVLIQALLDAPMFQTRWRWNATRALAMLRMRGGRRIPPAFQRIDAEDLLAVIFPDQQACLENIAGDREVPEHPLIDQTIDDCLHEFMDLEGLTALLQDIAGGRVKTHAVDLPEPSPLAHEILSAKPYAFLDDAPLEERRTQAVYLRRGLDLERIKGAGWLDPEAIGAVREQAKPGGTSDDEIHEALQLLGGLSIGESECDDWLDSLKSLVGQGRAGCYRHADGAHWIAAESLPAWQAAVPGGSIEPKITPPPRERSISWEAPEARVAILRRRLEVCGPITATQLAALFDIDEEDVETVLFALENEGVILRGHFEEALYQIYGDKLQWCDRRLLARIHHLTIGNLRARIKPVSTQAYMRFLLRWHHLEEEHQLREVDGVTAAIELLEGFEAAAGIWESELLARRVKNYRTNMLDQLCLSGTVGWGRVRGGDGKGKGGPLRSTPIGLFQRENADIWCTTQADELKGYAAQVYELLTERGALFFAQIVEYSRQLPTQVEMALGELVARGLVCSDSFAGLRALLVPAAKKPKLQGPRRRGFSTTPDVRGAGRWSLLAVETPAGDDEVMWEEEALEYRARVLLRRYGVVFRRLLEREPGSPRWRDLLDIYRRLEARGEVRGGRFVEGFSGEQFALPEAVAPLRSQREAEDKGELIVISAQDPLNLAGLITPGRPVIKMADNRLVLRDGIPLAAQEGGAFIWLGKEEPGLTNKLETLLRATNLPDPGNRRKRPPIVSSLSS